MFHSLLDMADIHYPDEKLDRSLFSKSLARHVRYVDSYGWTDYDDADVQGRLQGSHRSKNATAPGPLGVCVMVGQAGGMGSGPVH